MLKSFDFYPRMDSHGGDIVGRKVDGPLEFIAEVCRKNSECVAFNDNGWVKGILKDSSSWEEWTEDFSKGLYVKKACIDRDLYDSCGEKVRKNECNTSNPRCVPNVFFLRREQRTLQILSNQQGEFLTLQTQ